MAYPFRYIFFLFIFLVLAGFYQPVKAQTEQCGTVPFNQKLGKDGANKQVFERWMNRKLKERVSFSQRTAAEEVYIIPIVVHVIHNGEAEGVGSNIPYEQVLDQIRILNEDYRRQNADTVNTPEIFEPVAADTRIEFVLAQQDPDGFATNGVVRVPANRSSFGLNDASALSDLSYWPADQYLNIWVAPLSPGLLGFASFPVSDLAGLEDSRDNPFTDGVVIGYRFFGSIGNASSQSYGRTTSHEVGHFLGLRHIWGDGSCNVDDYVEDTPLQEDETTGCPTEKSSCGNINMFQNYMDYTDDVCMNLFTQDQKARMRIVLENSKRRTSLLTSLAKEPPVLVDNDAGIGRIISPAISECDGDIVPVISVFNAGNEPLRSFSVRLFLQGNLIEERQATTDLASGESTDFSFSALNVSQNSTAPALYDLLFEITAANDSADQNANNDQRAISFVIPQQDTLPAFENFQNVADSRFLAQSILRNPDNAKTWTVTDAPGFGENNQAFYLNFYEYANAFGEKDALYTPTYDFSNLESATLSFRIAYAPFRDEDTNEISQDGFQVGVSLDCGATLDTLIFDQAGEDLATHEITNNPFVPESRADWRRVEIPLDAFTGFSEVQLAFVGINDYGNNLYLDDIRIEGNALQEIDLAILRVNPPSSKIGDPPSAVNLPPLLSCQTELTPQVVIKNQGKVAIQSFEVNYQVDEQTPVSFVYNAFPLAPGEEMKIPLEPQNLPAGLHTLTIDLTNPNLQPDDAPNNNQKTVTFYVDNNRDILPLVEDFSKSTLADVLAGELPAASESWLVVNPDGGLTWEVAQAAGNGMPSNGVPSNGMPPNGTGNRAALIQHAVYEDIGATDRLVSPTLDFSSTNAASMIFKVSYALFSQNYVDTLRVLVSADCGQTYTTVYEQSGTDLAVTETDTVWVPANPGDWKEAFVDLSDFAGQSEVRVAFETVNGYGNNLYLDDIEFFVSNNRDRVEIAENTYRLYPNPTSDILNVVFNLEKREEVAIAMYNLQGQLLWQRNFPATLNQTYEFDVSAQPAGVYILRASSPSLNSSQRIIVY